MDDEVFKALADPSRRLLLDRLFERDGQSLVELQAGLPMTRFGVMKHLRILEEADLLTTRKVGREKLHYLNPVPIRLIHDRWISRYAEPIVAQLSALKSRLEVPMAAAPKHVFEVYIRTTPERLWRAITDPADTERYYYHCRVESDWTPGSSLRYVDNGRLSLDCIITEIEPQKRLAHTFTAKFDPVLAAEPPTRVTWEIEQMGELCRLRVTHDDFPAENATFRDTAEGWPVILSSLKSLVETGEPLHFPMPAETPA